jgi:hypothetical protein
VIRPVGSTRNTALPELVVRVAVRVAEV